MATAPNTPLESVEEYLNNSYSADVEYVNGLLVERGTPTIAHGTLAALLAGYFLAFRHEFGIAVVVECRTRIVEGARYRSRRAAVRITP